MHDYGVARQRCLNSRVKTPTRPEHSVGVYNLSSKPELAKRDLGMTVGRPESPNFLKLHIWKHHSASISALTISSNLSNSAVNKSSALLLSSDAGCPSSSTISFAISISRI